MPHTSNGGAGLKGYEGKGIIMAIEIPIADNPAEIISNSSLYPASTGMDRIHGCRGQKVEITIIYVYTGTS
jgi:hypothetical protein